MLKTVQVEAGRKLREDSMKGLANRLSSKAGASFVGLRDRTSTFYSRVAIGMSGWLDVSRFHGLTFQVWNSDLCMQQLEQWSAELQVLWDRWAELSGEAPVILARPRERMLSLSLGAGAGGCLHGAADVMWASVALGMLGIVAYVAWRCSS